MRPRPMPVVNPPSKFFCMIVNHGPPACHISLNFNNLDNSVISINGLKTSTSDHTHYDFFPNSDKAVLGTNEGHPWTYTVKGGPTNILVDSAEITAYHYTRDTIGQP
ncbi:hypothetical protein SAMD00019534_012870 [Acytostelium subglobosum LB1]|uniref:hypothetical protein n=1 Tax=Acytostelium subglobosum LB1 TaxID=1410327 RepID=UPI0006450FFF|nr:hypothetical protein SAMD00019534_012870 [Acytostelium subglobosum LB1]GAM18112.1 hypothetical protein SAMD00019534_012870 [Acytostelium subglobosum LB1]|eukprot:XP_012758708.1 hypothetical protein SAMD00019534_012870 [Acytostelium subglobosum LB1]